MLSKTFFAAIALASSMVSAAPAAEPVTDVEKRAAGGVYICTDINWGGTCGYQVQPLNTCIHLDFPWWHSISSFGPDQGTRCTWYTDYNCVDWIRTDVGHPGYADLTTVGANDAIGSFMCSD